MDTHRDVLPSTEDWIGSWISFFASPTHEHLSQEEAPEGARFLVSQLVLFEEPDQSREAVRAYEHELRRLDGAQPRDFPLHGVEGVAYQGQFFGSRNTVVLVWVRGPVQLYLNAEGDFGDDEIDQLVRLMDQRTKTFLRS